MHYIVKTIYTNIKSNYTQIILNLIQNTSQTLIKNCAIYLIQSTILQAI